MVGVVLPLHLKLAALHLTNFQRLIHFNEHCLSTLDDATEAYFNEQTVVLGMNEGEMIP